MYCRRHKGNDGHSKCCCLIYTKGSFISENRYISLTEVKVFHIQSGTKVTGYSVFKVFPVVTNNFHPILYFIFCGVTVISVGMSLISTLLSHIIMSRNRFLIINAMLPWGCGLLLIYLCADKTA